MVLSSLPRKDPLISAWLTLFDRRNSTTTTTTTTPSRHQVIDFGIAKRISNDTTNIHRDASAGDAWRGWVDVALTWEDVDAFGT